VENLKKAAAFVDGRRLEAFPFGELADKFRVVHIVIDDQKAAATHGGPPVRWLASAWGPVVTTKGWN